MIDPARKYTLKEIVQEKLLGEKMTYGILYNLVTHLEKNGKPTKTGYGERVLNAVTTERYIRAYNSGFAWRKISGKIYVEGKELIKFRQLNNL